MAVVVEGGLAIIAVVFAWIFHVPLGERLPAFGMPLVLAIARGLLATLPMLVIFWLMVNSNWPMLRQLRGQVEWLIREMFPNGSIPQFAMVAILAGVGEELLFRGAMQMKIGDWTTPVVGLVITSLLFGLAHALSKLYFLFAVAVGGFLGWLALQYHDLAAPIVAHAVYDFIALTYLSRRVSVGVENPPPIDDKPTSP